MRPLKVGARVNPRARTHDDRAGDPLDGLVNLFDLGIVLSVAFMLAALSSLDLESAIFSSEQGKVPEDTVVVEPGEEVRSIDLQPGEKVVGRGEQVGTVYRLTDGRTVIVQGEGSGEVDGSTGTGTGTGGSTTDPAVPPTTDDGSTTDDPPATDGLTPDTDPGATAPEAISP